jgi:hypothetical protein
MAWGRIPRYCCTNVSERCPYALDDALFSQAQFDGWGGRCTGDAGRPGCGGALHQGLAEECRPRWFAVGAAFVCGLVCVAFVLRTYVFPPPLKHIAFTSSRTTVVDTAGEAVIAVRRTDDLQAAARLQARFVDGSARSEEDYLASVSAIDLEPGQDQVLIRIPVLRDSSFRKHERHFSVVLDNVQDQPSHTVVITPSTVAPDSRVTITQSVLSASRIAADIGGLVVKVEAMEKLMSAYRNDTGHFEETRLQHRAAIDNLVRAREAYLRAVQDLRMQPAQEVLSTVDRLPADLRERGLKQQANTLPVLGRHLQELFSGKSADMDRWVTEIGATVPRVKGWNSTAPST